MTNAEKIAYELFTEYGMPQRQAAPLAKAMHYGEIVLGLVVDEFRERACDPRPWAAYHEAMLDALPRWRWLARARHRAAARRYRALIRSGKRISCK